MAANDSFDTIVDRVTKAGSSQLDTILDQGIKKANLLEFELNAPLRALTAVNAEADQLQTLLKQPYETLVSDAEGQKIYLDAQRELIASQYDLESAPLTGQTSIATAETGLLNAQTAANVARRNRQNDITNTAVASETDQFLQKNGYGATLEAYEESNPSLQFVYDVVGKAKGDKNLSSQAYMRLRYGLTEAVYAAANALPAGSFAELALLDDESRRTKLRELNLSDDEYNIMLEILGEEKVSIPRPSTSTKQQNLSFGRRAPTTTANYAASQTDTISATPTSVGFGTPTTSQPVADTSFAVVTGETTNAPTAPIAPLTLTDPTPTTTSATTQPSQPVATRPVTPQPSSGYRPAELVTRTVANPNGVRSEVTVPTTIEGLVITSKGAQTYDGKPYTFVTSQPDRKGIILGEDLQDFVSDASAIVTDNGNTTSIGNVDDPVSGGKALRAILELGPLAEKIATSLGDDVFDGGFLNDNEAAVMRESLRSYKHASEAIREDGAIPKFETYQNRIRSIRKKYTFGPLSNAATREILNDRELYNTLIALGAEPSLLERIKSNSASWSDRHRASALINSSNIQPEMFYQRMQARIRQREKVLDKGTK